MIDTLQLMLTDYDAGNAELELQPATVNTKTGELTGHFPLYVSNGSHVCGRKAFNNTGPCRVAIKAVPNAQTGGTQPMCTVALEVPKATGGSNYHPTDKQGTEDALRRIQQHLTEIGLKTNVMTAQPARVDMFNNVIADEPYSCYAPVLRLLSGSRMEQRGYENGFLWENGRQQVCAYDKLQKMVRDKLSIDGLPRNTIRFEMRLLNSSKVRDTLSVKSARELLDHYDELARAYHQTMKKQLFAHSVRDVDAMFASDMKAEMAWFQENAGRNWLDEWVKSCGWQFITQHTNMETVLGVVAELEPDRPKLSRIRKKMNKTRFDTEAMRCIGPSRRTTGQLYEEMREKVLSHKAA